MSQDPSTSSATEEPKVFTPGLSAIREHRARLDADHILDQFAERFTQRDYLPIGGDGLLFAMLTSLPQWSADMEISIVDDEGDQVACYLKGNDAELIQHTIELVLHEDGTYSASEPRNDRDERLFRAMFSQIPATSDLGRGGLDSSVSSRIATVREQIAGLARAERAQLFEALLADADRSKSEEQGAAANRFLPFWAPTPQDRSLSLWTLHQLNRQLPVERLEDLLRALPLTHAEENRLLQDEQLPDAFAAALEISRQEWTRNRAIDGLLHSRAYTPDTDVLARQFTRQLLKDRLDRGLVIVERGESDYEPVGPDDNQVVLWHGGEGDYLTMAQSKESDNHGQNRKSTDSFYLAISALLLAEERASLGLESERDITGFRNAVAGLAIDENGGWFESRHSPQANSALAPAWLKQLSDADKSKWSIAVQAYRQAVLDAQTFGIPDIATCGELGKLRSYARGKLRERLRSDHGLEQEPDDVILEIRKTLSVPRQLAKRPPVFTTTQSLTDLSLSNATFTARYAEASFRVIDNQGNLIPGLTHAYLYALVRDLDVSKDYEKYLKILLLTSGQGKGYAQRYVQVMQAQMRFDALDGKLAGDFAESDLSPAEQEDRAYKWVIAALDEPVDSDKRAKVEGHSISVGQVKVNGVTLDGLLLIGPSSRQAVPSFVVYTPQAPDGKCFRLLSSWEQLRESLFLAPDFLEYLVALAPPASQADVRESLTVALRNFILAPVLSTGNFFENAYHTRVARVIAAVDEQSNSTWEKNIESAAQIVSIGVGVALMFTPFKIALPIAALRSIYAMVQGIRNAAAGEERDAAGYFLEAGFSLLDMIPFPKTPKLKPAQTKPFIDRHTGVLNFDARPALPQLPDGLKLRTDGFYNGVHERVIDGKSGFYLLRNGKAYPVEPDLNNGVWRMIDLRQPNVTDKTPIFPDGQNVWRYHPPGGAGGGRLELDLTGFEQAKIFKKLDAHIEDRLLKAIETIEADFALDNTAHRFHPVGRNSAKENLFTFDISGMPNDRGRGAWRLRVRQPADNKGVLVFDEIMPWHKSKH